MHMQKSPIAQQGTSSGPGTPEPAGQVLSTGSDDAPSWEMCNFHMDMGSCFYPMTCEKHQGSHAETVHFRTPLFCLNGALIIV